MVAPMKPGSIIPLFVLVALLPVMAETRPNFVVILGEGHGWSSTSVRMDDAVPESKSSFVRTPILEKLAAGGMRLANFYAASPRCTPSRAALLTGKSPAQLHMTCVGEGKRENAVDLPGRVTTPVAVTELPTKETTIAEMLKKGGYATAHFGKWHLGRVSPAQHGFDESDGPTSNGGPDNVANPHPKQLFGMTARGIDFLSRQAKAGKPFYLQLSHYAARQGGDASPEALAAVKAAGGGGNDREFAQAAADFDLDLALGKLLQAIDDAGIAARTYVIFTTDHGTPGRNPPFAGGKGTVSEGGLRVPFVIRGPGIAAGACSQVRAIGEDLVPTIASLAKIPGPMPVGVEGGSLVEILTSGGRGTVRRSREHFVVHFPHYDKDSAGPATAIWAGEYKLVRRYDGGTLQLFDLAKDPGERNDLNNKMPDKAGELDTRLSVYLKEVGAQVPESVHNDPGSSPRVETRRGGKRKAKP